MFFAIIIKLYYGVEMRKFSIKKIAFVMMFLMSFSFILTGCSLLTKNLAKYYDTVVVSIEYPNGDLIEINKKELITAFNNYGASLVSNSGYTVEDAMNSTITALINQKVLLKESELTVGLTNKQKNSLWDDTFEAIESNIDTFISEVREDWDIVSPTENESEEEDFVIYEPYEKTAELVYENGKYVIRVIRENEPEETLKYADMADEENKDLIVGNLYNAILSKTNFTAVDENSLTDIERLQRQEARVYEEAINRYIKLLKTNEEGLNLSTDNVSVFKREIKRIYENKLDSAKIEVVQKRIAVDETYSSITPDDVLNKYKELMIESIQKYKLNSSQFDTDVLSSFSSINYSTNENYFFVSHILLKYSDEQQAEYDALESKLSSGEISAISYKQSLQDLANEIVAIERDEDGKVINDSHKYSYQVLTEIQNALGLAQTEEQKAEVFRNLLYKYNQDDGANNAEYLYVVGTENSQMVESFTLASRELYDNGNGEFGSISNLVPSEYGVHIVFYAGPITEVFPIFVNSIDNVNLTMDDLGILNETLLNPLNNKTLFDKVFSSITESTSSTNEVMYLNYLKKDLNITKYKSRYNDLLG